MGAPVILTREQSRLVDRIAIDEYGIPGVVLMENAGRGVVDVLLDVDPALFEVCQASSGSPRDPGPEGVALRLDRGGAGAPCPLVAILCGKGNNAGDGFVIARHLEIRGVAATVLLLCPPDELAGDARRNFDILVRAEAAVVDLATNAGADAAALPGLLDRHAGGATWLVDALLGTGAQGPPREPFRTAIAWMNAQPGRRLAVDVPSGLDCDTGERPGGAVRATVTCTFVAAKPGLLAPQAAEWVGELRVVPIGVPAKVLRDLARRC